MLQNLVNPKFTKLCIDNKIYAVYIIMGSSCLFMCTSFNHYIDTDIIYEWSDKCTK